MNVLSSMVDLCFRVKGNAFSLPRQSGLVGAGLSPGKTRPRIFAAYVIGMNVYPRKDAGAAGGGQFTVRNHAADEVVLDPVGAEYLIGAATDLSPAQHRALTHLVATFDWPATIAVHNPDTIDIVYAPWGDFTNVQAVRIRLDGAGHVISGGHGIQWEDPDTKHPVIQKLMADSTDR